MVDSGGESATAVVTIPGLRGGEGSLVLVKLSDRGTTAHVYQRENPRLWTWYVDQVTPANADQADSAPMVVAAGTADSRVEAIESAMSAFAVHYEKAPVFFGARLRNLRWRLEEAEAAEAAAAEAELRESCRRKMPLSGALAQILEEALSRTERDRDEARAEVERAYRRGAEAMRTAAMGAAWHSAAMGLYKRIQEMPIPEDK